MVFYSIKSKDRVFHLTDCVVNRRIKRDNRRQFDTPELAREAGLRMCNRCAPMGRKLQRELPEINKFANDHEIAYQLRDNVLHITSRCGEWAIIMIGKRNIIFLYHKNLRPAKSSRASVVPGYHSQAVRADSILGYLQYIAAHDIYRGQQIQEKNKRRELRRNTYPYQRGSDNRHFGANQLYSLLDFKKRK